MSMMKEFKEFAVKGNVLDMAVGVIVGAAFGGIVNSVINDMMMPVFGKLIGNADFRNLYIPLSDKISAGMSLEEARKLGAVFAYGNFITIVINFMILAVSVFFVVRAFNAMRTKLAEAEATPAVATTKECPHCLSTIALKATRCAHCTAEVK